MLYNQIIHLDCARNYLTYTLESIYSTSPQPYCNFAALRQYRRHFVYIVPADITDSELHGFPKPGSFCKTGFSVLGKAKTGFRFRFGSHIIAFTANLRGGVEVKDGADRTVY